MREILFRGKFVKDWKYGYLSVEPKGLVIKEPYELNQSHIWHIDPSTVGQYTGLTDKNGKKIFEGDILEFTDADKDKTPYEIYWDESSSAWHIRDCEGCIDNCDPWVKECFEVIGNVHDNPELLEVSE